MTAGAWRPRDDEYRGHGLPRFARNDAGTRFARNDAGMSLRGATATWQSMRLGVMDRHGLAASR